MTEDVKQRINSLSMKELLALYNSTTGESVKRFTSRAAGMKRTIAALEKKEQATTRTVRGTSGLKLGRPVLNFDVKLTNNGRSKVRATSLRGQVLAYMSTCEGSKAGVAALKEKFGEKVKGVIMKLIEAKHLARVEA